MDTKSFSQAITSNAANGAPPADVLAPGRFNLTVQIALALCLVACGGVAEAPPQLATKDFPTPSHELVDPYSSLSAATEFGGGRLVLVDGTENEVSLVDFESGSRRVIGQRGAGPGEYVAPIAVLRLPGDTLVVLDAPGGPGSGSARAVRYHADLSVGSTSSILLFSRPDTSVVGGTIFAGDDGSVFAALIKLVMTPTGRVPSDTLQVVRFELGPSPTFTKVAQIAVPQPGPREQRLEGKKVTVKSPFAAMVPADAWAAFPDGRVAIVRGDGYTVEFATRDGEVTEQIPIPFDRIPLTDRDREAELARAREQMATDIVAIRRSMMPGFTLNIEITAPPSWPEAYPPITPMVAHAAPNGNLWVKRATPVRIDREVWDEIDSTGELVARWRLPQGVRLVAVGVSAVYTTRSDDDQLLYLQRIPMSP